MDRYLVASRGRSYVFRRPRSHLGDEIQWKPGGIIEGRAREVLASAHHLLAEVKRDSIWDAIATARSAT